MWLRWKVCSHHPPLSGVSSEASAGQKLKRLPRVWGTGEHGKEITSEELQDSAHNQLKKGSNKYILDFIIRIFPLAEIPFPLPSLSYRAAFSSGRH